VQEGKVAKVGEGLSIIEVDKEASNLSDTLTSEPPDANATSDPLPNQENKRVVFKGHSSAAKPQPAFDKPPLRGRFSCTPWI
jgi:hypothetical protein